MLTKIGKHYIDTAAITYATRGDANRLGIWLGGSDRPVIFEVGGDADALEAELERLAGGGGPTDRETELLRLLGRIVDAHDTDTWHDRRVRLMALARAFVRGEPREENNPQ